MDTPDTPAAAPTHGDAYGHFLDEKAFKSRKVLVFGAITDTLANDTVRRLLALASDSSQPIDVFVSSPGGHVESGDAIHDIVRFIDAPVTMIGTGWVGSAAAHVYLSVPHERRLCLPNTRFLIHQPSGGAGGSASSIAIQAREIVRIRERIARIIARETGKAFEQVMSDIERDHWLSAQEAVDYGLVSRIAQSQAQVR